MPNRPRANKPRALRPRIKILGGLLGVSLAALAAGVWASGYAPSATRSAQPRLDFDPVGTIPATLAAPAPASAPNEPALRGSSARTDPQLEDSIGVALLERADAPAIRQALEAYRKGDLAAGDSAAANALDDVARNALRWAALRLAPAKAGYRRIADFVDSNPGWPSDGFLQARLEEALINEKIPPAQVRARFMNSAPATAMGRYALARALRDESPAESKALARKIWREDDFGSWLESQMQKEFGAHLRAEDHSWRAARLFYKESHVASQRIAALAGADVAALSKARIALSKNTPADKLVDAVPKTLRNDPSLIFAQAQKLRRADKFSEAADLLEQAPRDGNALVDGDAWWTERRINARKLLDAGDAQKAYTLAANHSARSSEDRIEAQFHAGWIALRFRNDPASALPHFVAAGQIARTPISKARALYWQARAAEARGAEAEALELYESAAQHSTAYYGQLARARLGHTDQPVRRAAHVADGLARIEPVRAVEAFEAVGERELAFRLTSDLARKLDDPAQIAALAHVAARAQNARAALVVGKLASQRGIALDDIAFPMFGVPQYEALPRSAEQPVVYSIARQESAFQSDALSHAGARGLMQMLPSTARRTAQRAGVPFDEKRLILDPAYNAQLGAAHLTELMDEHGQSLILTFAAYNAGGHRVKQWIAAYGDPRKPDVDPIDWVERIPFTETRNYVQRVVENVGVYRARFGAPDAKGLIVDDLRARQVRLAASQ
jgi:soluble lytic murein transglycosylase